MPLTSEVRSTFLASISTAAIRMVTVPAAAGISIASGAPGAVSILLADGAVVVDLWIMGAAFDTPAAAALFTVQMSTPAAGTTQVASMRFEVATDAGWYPPIWLPVPIRIAVVATNGIAGRQLLASGQTINMSAIYCTGLNG